jgi:UDPglucose--hexose-1-phosphate uridylyltransferase
LRKTRTADDSELAKQTFRKPEEDFSVVCFSPKHNLTLPEMPAEAIENIVHTWQKNIQI